MAENKEKLTPLSIIFFDADKTLWKVESLVEGDDYASRGAFDGRTRHFILRHGVVRRVEDGTKFILKERVVETLNKLAKEGVVIGIISDNVHQDVERVGKLLGIWRYFDTSFVNIRLWQGPADKKLMIKEIIEKQQIGTSPKIVLVDDSERYAEQIFELGHNFILSPKDTFPEEQILRFFRL